MDRHRQERIDCVALIFPALADLAHTEGGERFAPLLSSAARCSLAVTLASGFALLPRDVRSAAARLILGRSDANVEVDDAGTTLGDVLADAICGSTVCAVLTMARHEMVDVRALDDAPLRAVVGGREPTPLVALFTEGDPWCDASLPRAVEEACDDGERCIVRCFRRDEEGAQDPHPEHAFVRRAEDVDAVSTALFALLRRAGLAM